VGGLIHRITGHYLTPFFLRGRMAEILTGHDSQEG
jgi:hypothetical protein